MTAALEAWHGQNLSPHPEERLSGPAFGRPKDKSTASRRMLQEALEPSGASFETQAALAPQDEASMSRRAALRYLDTVSGTALKTMPFSTKVDAIFA
jgi:hypothetical protein